MGTFQPSVGATACASCGAGVTTRVRGATSSLACVGTFELWVEGKNNFGGLGLGSTSPVLVLTSHPSFASSAPLSISTYLDMYAVVVSSIMLAMSMSHRRRLWVCVCVRL